MDNNTENQTNQNTTVENTEENNTETTQSFTSEEMEAEVTRRLNEARSQWERETQQRVTEATSEAQRLAQLSESERNAEQQRIERENFENERQRFEQERLVFEAGNQLADKNLPSSFASFLARENADTTKANIDDFSAKWSKALQDAVDKRLKSEPPKSGTGTQSSDVGFMDIIRENQR